jgi:hypothetical protein
MACFFVIPPIRSESAVPVDAETAYHVRQAYVSLGLHPRGAAVEPPPLTRDTIQRAVRAAFAELDMRQLAISKQMTPADRFRQLCAINEFLRRAVIAAIHEQHPGLDEREFQEEFLRRMGLSHERS